MKEVGIWNLHQLLQGLDAFSFRLLIEVLGWTKEEVIVFLAGVRKDLKNPNVHGYYNL